MSKTSFEKSSQWYISCVGEKGHYYHRKIILPNLKTLFHFQEDSCVLDLGCGEGILERNIPSNVEYLGIDLSSSLIKQAKKLKKSQKHQFLVKDITQSFDLKKKDFTHACFILCLQNIEDAKKALLNASRHLKVGGKLFLVLNHPAFRIPKHTLWRFGTKKQTREVESYMSKLKIPIQTNPSKKNQSKITYSFHRPLSTYFRFLKEADFITESLYEWCSDKKSTGKKAALEDRARKEFPLFLSIVAIKTKK